MCHKVHCVKNNERQYGKEAHAMCVWYGCLCGMFVPVWLCVRACMRVCVCVRQYKLESVCVCFVCVWHVWLCVLFFFMLCMMWFIWKNLWWHLTIAEVKDMIFCIPGFCLWKCMGCVCFLFFWYLLSVKMYGLFYLRFWIILFVGIWTLLLFMGNICNTLSWTFTCERLKCMGLQSMKYHGERVDVIQTHTYTHSLHKVNNSRLELDVETTVRAQIQAEKAEM